MIMFIQVIVFFHVTQCSSTDRYQGNLLPLY